jgi:hypothetical protein
MEILKYHSRNKPLENEALLSSVAEVTQVPPDLHTDLLSHYADVRIIYTSDLSQHIWSRSPLSLSMP